MADTDKPKKPENPYKDTLFLPTTDFPMRGGLPKAEPKWIEKWDEMNLYERFRSDAKARGAEPFILHDGPPYANGPIHLGTAMNKIIKDIIVRNHQMRGYDASYLPGWDCHGLPIEWKVEEQFRSKGRTKDDVPGDEFRRACREYAAEWIEVQKAGFRRCGVEGEWDDPYLTMNFESEAATVREFLAVAMGGRLVRGAKPVMWSPVERTALAEAEVEYHDRKVPVIWVKFPVKSGPADLTDASVVIWTTTPWTIPANQAVSFSPSIEYSLFEVEDVATEEELGFAPYVKTGDKLIVADRLVETVMNGAKAKSYRKVQPVTPTADFVLQHPLADLDAFFEHDIPMLAGDHVTDDAGTGFVHTAPAHGEDDFNVWVESGRTTQQIRQIVDPDGCYTDDVPEPLRGLDIIRTSGKKRGQPGKANPEVIRLLAESGNLLARGVTEIRDAHSWRSKAPVIRRATPQWFIAMDTPGKDGSRPLREMAMDGIEQTKFVPPTGYNRLKAMVADRPDWLISRQRNWGVPITLLVSPDGEPHTTALSANEAETVNQRILEAIRAEGVEAWFSADVETFLDGVVEDASKWEKVNDVLDVWFDSGTTHAFALRDRGIIDDATGVADVYMEGSDQHRGWFQSSLLESCATRGMAPFKQVVTHGMIVDGEGKKMSKRDGNVIDPNDFGNQYGIEILRLWTATSDYTEDLRISDEIIKGAVENYRRLRNTMRYLLGALHGFTPDEAVLPVEMPSLETWVLHRLAELDETVRKAYDEHDFKRVMTALLNFCSVDLSAVYFDIRKDSLYCDAPSDVRRRSARTVMAAILERLLAWLAPIMPFTTEETFLMSPFAGRADSVHLLQFPETPLDWKDADLAARWDKIFRVRRVVTGAIEIERREKRIGSSLEAAPKVFIDDPDLLAAYEGEAAEDIFITSQAELVAGAAPDEAFRLPDEASVAAVPGQASGVKCARSWKYFDPATADPEFPDVTPRDAAAIREVRG
ncbi:MAG: isoleucine--tRNA ligase [Hyphomonadaceae bacterium]|nr:isoleucine--tRNA ligase [Hyphomonadaceae bacterium]